MSDQPPEGSEPNRPRQPNNLQGLLRFAVEATRSEDAPAQAANIAPMDPDRRRFLEDAINSMTVNVGRQLEVGCAVLTNPESSESDRNEALDGLLDYADNIDTANDFCKIGGLEIILPLLEPLNPDSVRSNTAALIAELAQNNPFAQAKLLELNALSKLLPLLTKDQVCVNAIRAISSMSRNYEPLAASFIEMGGLECLLGCLQFDNERLKIQSTFLLTSICTEYPEVRNELVRMNAMDQIAGQVEARVDYCAQLEATLSLINVLTTDNQFAIDRCRPAGLNLYTKLKDIRRQGGDKPECQEINEFSHILLERLFDDTSFANASNAKEKLLDDVPDDEQTDR